MGRTPKPWYREDRDAWYVTIKGKRHLVARGKQGREAAERKFHRIMADPGAAKPVDEPVGVSVASVCRLYLQHAEAELAPQTFQFYLRHLKSFAQAHPALAVAGLRPHHVVSWAGSKGWNPTTRAGAITAVKRAFSWAAKVGHVTDDPIRTTEKPRALRREVIPDQAQVERFLAAIDNPNFRDLVIALRESGCRPGEVFAMDPGHFDPARGTWTVINKTRHHGPPTRTIYLTPEMVEMSARLARARPKGPLFVNSRGDRWTRHAVIHRFIRLRKKLGMGPEVTAYALHHLFVTDALEQGVPSAHLAQLVGHKGSTMIDNVYSHLSDRADVLRGAVRKARGKKIGGDQKP